MTDFDVLIIAAGEGSRLKAEGINRSKPMIEIAGERLIERLLRIILKYQPASVSLIINEESIDLHDYLKEYNFTIPLNLIVKSTPSSLHSFVELSRFIKQNNFLLTTTDSIFAQAEFSSFYKSYISRKDKIDGLISVTGYIDDEKPLCAELDELNKIVRFTDSKTGCNFATGGIYFFNSAVISEVEEAVSAGTNRLRNYLKLLIAKKYKLFAYEFDKIIDVDHKADITEAEKFLMTISH